MDRAGGPPWRSPAAPRPTVAEFLRQCLRELAKVLWPDGRAVRRNASLVFLTVMTVVVGLGALELAISQVVGGLLS